MRRSPVLVLIIDRSKIEIASGAGFHAVGQSVSANPTLIDMMPGGGTYYTFVDSGAFTIQYASMTNMDESGVQIYFSSGVFSINDSTFDYSGNGIVSTSTFFTLNGVTQSTITLFDVTYGSSRANTHNYNYNILGSSVGLHWINQQYSGTLTGANHTQDDTTQLHILWEPVGCSTITSIVNGNWSSTNTWDAGFVPTSCNPVYIISGTTVTLDTNAVASTVTITGQLSASRVVSSTLTQTGGNLYVNAGGTLDLGTSVSPIPSSLTSTLNLSLGTTAGQYGLTINSGGSFFVYGSTKTPFTIGSTITSGTSLVVDTSNGLVNWSTGDVITLGQADGLSSADNTEARIIAGISGGALSRWAAIKAAPRACRSRTTAPGLSRWPTSRAMWWCVPRALPWPPTPRCLMTPSIPPPIR